MAEQIYQSRFLLNDLLPAALKMDRNDYAEFQLNEINKLCPQFQSDFLTVNILHLNAKFLLDGEITSAVARTPLDTITSYEKVLLHDSFTPLTFLNSGTAFFNDAVREIDDWIDQPIYTEHCTPFDHHWVLGVSYRYPHHKKTFVAFDYMRAKGEPYFSDLREEYVEYISYPFYLGWLHLYGAICSDTLRDWLVLCAGMSKARFLVIRGIAGEGITRAPDLSSALGLKSRTIHRHVEMTFDNILSVEPEKQIFEGNADRVATIARAYRFMQFGSGSARRQLPRKLVNLG